MRSWFEIADGLIEGRTNLAREFSPSVDREPEQVQEQVFEDEYEDDVVEPELVNEPESDFVQDNEVEEE